MSWLFESKEAVKNSLVLREVFCLYKTFLGLLHGVRNNEYRAMQQLCAANKYQVHEGEGLASWMFRHFQGRYLLENPERPFSLRDNRILRSFVTSEEAREIRREYRHYPDADALRIRLPRADGDATREGMLAVLKNDLGGDERGVLYLQYTAAIKKFVALYRVEEFAHRYILVVEPSTWGYYDESLLLLSGLDVDVVVQAQDEIDFNITRRLGPNFHPIRLGAADWVDLHAFAPTQEQVRDYDFVMVASWLRLKRHELFFKALRESGLTTARVALVGYPWGGRTREDVLKEAKRHGVADQIDWFEKVPPAKVAEILSRSKCALMLSRREGANKALYEAFACNTPALVSDCNRGVNRLAVNSQTGCLVADRDLPAMLRHMVEHYRDFEPRRWLEANSGYEVSRKRLDALIGEIEASRGGRVTRAIQPFYNKPNLRFATDEGRQLAELELAKLKSFYRESR